MWESIKKKVMENTYIRLAVSIVAAVMLMLFILAVPAIVLAVVFGIGMMTALVYDLLERM